MASSGLSNNEVEVKPKEVQFNSTDNSVGRENGLENSTFETTVDSGIVSFDGKMSSSTPIVGQQKDANANNDLITQISWMFKTFSDEIKVETEKTRKEMNKKFGETDQKLEQLSNVVSKLRTELTNDFMQKHEELQLMCKSEHERMQNDIQEFKSEISEQSKQSQMLVTKTHATISAQNDEIVKIKRTCTGNKETVTRLINGVQKQYADLNTEVSEIRQKVQALDNGLPSLDKEILREEINTIIRDTNPSLVSVPQIVVENEVSVRNFQDYDPKQGLHAVAFIKQFKHAFPRHFTERAKINTCVSHMKGEAHVWGINASENYSLYSEFETAFLNKFWSKEKQWNVKSKILMSPNYARSHGTMREYIQKFWNDNAYLDDPVNEEELMLILIQKLPYGVREKLLLAPQLKMEQICLLIDRIEMLNAEREQRERNNEQRQQNDNATSRREFNGNGRSNRNDRREDWSRRRNYDDSHDSSQANQRSGRQQYNEGRRDYQSHAEDGRHHRSPERDRNCERNQRQQESVN